jgi:hypothetical protein
VSHPAARLLGLAVFVLLGWGVGELWTSVVESVELNAVREVAAQLTATLTDMARIATWASDVVAGLLLGSGWAVYVSRCVREHKVQ